MPYSIDLTLCVLVAHKGKNLMEVEDAGQQTFWMAVCHAGSKIGHQHKEKFVFLLLSYCIQKVNDVFFIQYEEIFWVLF